MSHLRAYMVVKSGTLEKFVPSRRMHRCHLRVAIPTADEIHMEDRNETMVLPELSRTMASTTRKTVRLARKQPHLNRADRTTKGGINLYIELGKHKLDQIETFKCL